MLEQIENYAKQSSGQLVKIMQIDNKFVPRVCKALIHKLVTTKNKQHKQPEVQLLVFNLIKEIM